MDGDVELLKRIYDRFNARDIDGEDRLRTCAVAAVASPAAGRVALLVA
jgi:hypothetical protein